MTPHIDEARKFSPIRPFKAAHHMRKLLADKEDTVQVFHIMEALNGKNLKRKLMSYSATSEGQELLKRRRDLPKILDDHETLKKLPKNTVGRAYVAFMEREGLSAAGLVEESEKWWKDHEKFDDDIDFLGRRFRDTHDLYHVLTGYGRDKLGEVCVLGFSHAHNGGFGNLFISYVGAWDLSKTAPDPRLVKASLKEARRHGRAAKHLALEDIVALLAEPLDEARQRMNIAPPTTYITALKSLEAIGYDGVMSAA